MNNTKYINTFFSLSLLLVFVVCAFFLLLFQVNGYKKVNDENEYIQHTHTPMAYISNKVRSSDDVMIDNIENQNVLVLKNSNTTTYIYEYNASLYELSFLNGTEVQLSLGEPMFECDHLTMTFKQNVLHIEYTYQEDVNDMYIKRRKEDFNE